MRGSRLAVISLSTIAILTGTLAARAESDWQKSYPISAKASVTVSTGDASLDIHSCAACREVRVRVEWNERRQDDFTITEFQSGDHVNFELKEKYRMGIHINIGIRHTPQVTIETPPSVSLEARTVDGSLKVAGIAGTLELHSGDGAVEVSDIQGAVRLTASDGSIRIHNVNGTLESRTSDGSVTIDGRFSGLQVHSGDGRLNITLADGSQLTSSSRIESSDGRVTVKLPKTLAVDLEVHTSDGHINCELPLTVNGYNSASGSGHNLRGRLNNGGTPLTIHTSDGNVTIEAL